MDYAQWTIYLGFIPCVICSCIFCPAIKKALGLGGGGGGHHLDRKDQDMEDMQQTIEGTGMEIGCDGGGDGGGDDGGAQI